MNKKIEKLANNVNAWFPNGYPSGEGGDEEWLNYVIFRKEQLQKFAELIVGECAETIQDFVDHRFPASEYPSRLKRYFGVEE